MYYKVIFVPGLRLIRPVVKLFAILITEAKSLPLSIVPFTET